MKCNVKYQFLIDIILATFIHVNISEPQQNIRKYIINQEQPGGVRRLYIYVVFSVTVHFHDKIHYLIRSEGSEK